MMIRVSLCAFGLFTFGFAAAATEITVPARPGENLSLTLAAIGSARSSIRLNVYQMSSPEIAGALAGKIRDGVTVEIFEEGQPLGGISASQKTSRRELLSAFAQPSRRNGFFREITSAHGGKRRYRWDHAKYIVIDDSSVLIGSENYTTSGNASPGKRGNRGWEVWVKDAELARSYGRTFAFDSDPASPDVADVGSGDGALLCGRGGARPDLGGGGVVSLDAGDVEKITSPDTSLNGLLSLLRGASRSLDVEQLTLEAGWGKAGKSSPLVEELIAAARRGVHVRVLVNPDGKSGMDEGERETRKIRNQDALDILKQAARGDNLPIEARFASLSGMRVALVHNKGVVADGTKTLVSSINWDENSVGHNREAAVTIDGAEVASYFSTQFDADWAASQ